MTTKPHLDTVLWQLKQVNEALERAKFVLRDDNHVSEDGFSLLNEIESILSNSKSTEKWVRRLRDA